jgi:GntR family transcriptional regulator / MocR family aminotransferase
VRCTPEQIIVTAGAQQAMDLVARLLADPDDAAWIEEPGYVGARGALAAAGLRLVPLPVDGEGLDVESGRARWPNARVAYVTPSRQYPLGVTMSLQRRRALLAWAQQAQAWILEDDYDSEYRYAGRPLASLQGMDEADRVLYLGTLSKVLFPSLRLGYVVVPPTLVDSFTSGRAVYGRHAPGIDQAILAEFIAEGHLARHIRRMRRLYAERQAILVELCHRHLAGLLEVEEADAGMQFVGWLPEGVDDQALAACLREHGIVAAPLSVHYLGEPPRRRGLVLGFGGSQERQMADAAKRMAEVIRGFVGGTRRV